METVCRLCLTVPSHEMSKMTEGSEVLFKISSCMLIQIKLSESLPDHVCNTCINRINEVYIFHKEITENQRRLQELIASNQATKFNRINEVLIKQEKYIDTENMNTLNINQDINIDDNYLSEDEINLFALKKEKNNSKLKRDKDKSKNKKISKKRKKHKIKDKPVTIIQKYETYTFKCLVCLKNCESQNDLKNHYYEHTCEINDKGQENEPKFNGESKTEKCELTDECKCNNESCKCRNGDKIKHDKPFICKLCGRTYKTVYEIMCHARAHDGPKLHCSFKCGFSTAYKGALKEHERRHGNPEYKYTCESCGKGFHVKTWYYQHLNVHNGLKPFVCDICGVGFHMDRYLSAHRSKVHKKSSSTKRHICVICLLPCDSRDSLKRHMEEHGVKTSYLCDLCGKVFANAQHLKCHKNIHLGVKPYSCNDSSVGNGTDCRDKRRRFETNPKMEHTPLTLLLFARSHSLRSSIWVYTSVPTLARDLTPVIYVASILCNGARCPGIIEGTTQKQNKRRVYQKLLQLHK